MVGNGGRQQRPWSNKPFYPARLWSTARLDEGPQRACHSAAGLTASSPERCLRRGLLGQRLLVAACLVPGPISL